MSVMMAPGRRVWVIYTAGQVKRWHMKGHVIRTQDLAQHSHGVATWISLLHPDPSAKLLKAALHHDFGELRSGDPSRFAKMVHPELAVILETIESQMALQYGLQTEDGLTDEEVMWLRGADLFDAWLFLMQNIICYNEMVRDDFTKCTRALRLKTSKYPILFAIVVEQILSMHPWVKTW